MLETTRQLATPEQRLERIQMLSQIRASKRAFYTFISKMAQNRKFAEERPNTHKFFVSLNNHIEVRGELTPKQKVAINAQIDKYADYIMTLRVAKPAPVVQVASESDEALIEDAPLDESQALDDERAGMQEA